MAVRPVAAALALSAVLLAVFSNRYGFERDELYFRMLHPAWGYVDQPPLTPLLVRTFAHLADQPWAIRIPALLAAVSSTYVVVLVTRELGGGRGPQALCAWAYAFAGLPLNFGHVTLTSSIDLVVWPLVTLLVMRALLRDDGRWWLWTGLVVGLSMYNKLLVATLLLSLGTGVLVCGPRRALLSRWVAGGAVIALVVGSPNLIYQVAHGWPQLDMGRALAAHNAADVRTQMFPLLALLLGPPLVPIWIAGLVALARRPQWRAVRGLPVAFGVLLVLVFAMGAQPYYPIGLLSVVFAAGCVPAWDWMQRSRTRRRVVTGAVAVNMLVAAVIALPLVPVGDLHDTPIPGANQAVADSVGWPVYVGQIRAVVRGLSPADRRRAVVVASNYGEAGAVARFGADLPPVFSGQNALAAQARPPQSATVVVLVGGQLSDVRALFASCRVVAHLDNRVGVDNEEQGEPIAVCRSVRGGWRAAWPRFAHLD